MVEGVSLGSKGEKGVPASVHGVGTPAEEADRTRAGEAEVSEGVSASVHRVDTPEEEELLQDHNLTWVECVEDKRSWAELLE